MVLTVHELGTGVPVKRCWPLRLIGLSGQHSLSRAPEPDVSGGAIYRLLKVQRGA